MYENVCGFKKKNSNEVETRNKYNKVQPKNKDEILMEMLKG